MRRKAKKLVRPRLNNTSRYSDMTKSPHTQTREQKLAAKLKENLRRRKAQARARTAADTGQPGNVRQPQSKPGSNEN